MASDASMKWGNQSDHLARCKVSSKNENKSTNIRVAVRVRPPNTRELAGETGGGICIKIDPDEAEVVIETNPARKYNFDVVRLLADCWLSVFSLFCSLRDINSSAAACL